VSVYWPNRYSSIPRLGLEEDAGVSSKKVCYAHGSLQWATCCKCKRRVSSKEIMTDILNGTVARCQAPITAAISASISREPSARAAASRKRSRSLGEENCGSSNIGRNGEGVCGGVMKPGVTFFGEALHNNVKSKLESDREKVDALIVIGTSLSV
jgi:NAD-dependent SIR2 family protein deacetylase